MEASISPSCEELQCPSVPPKYYVNSRGRVRVVQVDVPGKTEPKRYCSTFLP